MPSNKAAYFPGPKVKPVAIKEAPYSTPSAHQILIRNHAVAVNPIDWICQSQGVSMVAPWVKYPAIFGSDVAGEVVEVGSSITRFKIGDRVVGHAVGVDKNHNDPAQGGFQLYTILLEHMVAKIAHDMEFESACVIPLGLSTGACGLFQRDMLGLRLPGLSSSATEKEKKREVLLVWGGSTSVGCNTIQLGVNAGYDVYTTCSPRNFELMKTLGATRVFDYNSPTVVKDIIHTLEGKTCAGAISIGAGAADACAAVLRRSKGKKFIAMATYPVPQPPPQGPFGTLITIWSFASWTVKNAVMSRIGGYKNAFIYGSTLVDNGVGKAVYQDFLEKALAEGRFKAAPEPLVVGKGLESIQLAFDTQREGVSARKVVVSL